MGSSGITENSFINILFRGVFNYDDPRKEVEKCPAKIDKFLICNSKTKKVINR